MPSTTAERYTDNSGLTALNLFKLQAAFNVEICDLSLKAINVDFRIWGIQQQQPCLDFESLIIEIIDSASNAIYVGIETSLIQMSAASRQNAGLKDWLRRMRR
jgi:hypothetical protein